MGVSLPHYDFMELLVKSKLVIVVCVTVKVWVLDDGQARKGSIAQTIRATKLGAVPRPRIKSAPAPGKAGVQTPTENIGIHGTKKHSGPPQEGTTTSTPVRFCCETCEVSYSFKANMARHAKKCGTRDRSKCQHCSSTFESFASVRQHECRAHPKLYRTELESKIGAPEPVLMAKIANVEARSKKGVISIRELAPPNPC
ncbi:hypothetical protein QE152_g19534 [Popillia japonica]|uniref:C2H2-type domain-containing protein n=1 Tax=Popillia japonica TaxID=7064 RepID=A0AAW1KRI0_POPJA